MRRFGSPPRRGIRYTDRPGAYAAILAGGRLLVTEQSDPDPEIQLPGGGIDAGESPVATLHRETFEETGWRIRVIRRLGVYQNYKYMPEYDLWARKICHVYLAAPVRRVADPTEPAHRALWIDPIEATRVLGSSGDRHFVARLVAGQL